MTGTRGLRGQIEDIVYAEPGTSLEELTDRTKAPFTAVRAAVFGFTG